MHFGLGEAKLFHPFTEADFEASWTGTPHSLETSLAWLRPIRIGLSQADLDRLILMNTLLD